MRGASRGPGADHRALLYDDPAGFVAGVADFVRDGLKAEQRVMVSAVPEKLAWVREELGADGGAVDFRDAEEMYERPGLAFSQVARYLEHHADDGGGVRVVAEQSLAPLSRAEVRAYMRYEATANVAFERLAASILCPYDRQLLDEADAAPAVRCTHRDIVENGRTWASPQFTDARSFVRASSRRHEPPGDATIVGIDRAGDVAIARRLIDERAAAAGLSRERTEDLLVAGSEVASNALLHGRAPCQMWIYEDEGAMVCQVRDAGRGPDDPLAGYLPPDPDGPDGRGLWIAHQFCDIVEVARGEGGTEVYLRLGEDRRDAAPGD